AAFSPLIAGINCDHSPLCRQMLGGKLFGRPQRFFEGLRSVVHNHRRERVFAQAIVVRLTGAWSGVPSNGDVRKICATKLLIGVVAIDFVLASDIGILSCQGLSELCVVNPHIGGGAVDLELLKEFWKIVHFTMTGKQLDIPGYGVDMNTRQADCPSFGAQHVKRSGGLAYSAHSFNEAKEIVDGEVRCAFDREMR